jgi:hypothetical protein
MDEVKRGDRSPDNRSGDRPYGPAPATELGASELGHETQDVSIGPIVKFGAGLAIATALVSVAMWGLFRWFEANQDRRQEPVAPMVATNLKRTPREPRLEPDPLAPRLAARAGEDAVLTSWGWVDRNAGVARIPIDRAMELLAQRGLPAPKPMVPVTPVVTPGTVSRQPAPHPNPLPPSGEREKVVQNR